MTLRQNTGYDAGGSFAMAAIGVTILFGLVLSAFSAEFGQSFWFPKLLALGILACFGAGCLYLRGPALPELPKKGLWGVGAYFLWLTLASAFSPEPLGSFHALAHLFCALVLYLVVVSRSATARQQLKLGLFVVSAFQAALAILQRLGLEWPGAIDHTVTGTVGNPEFLATLLSVALCLLVDDIKKKGARSLAFLAAGLLLMGILATGSKGTLLILAFFLIWWLSHRLALITLLVSVTGFGLFGLPLIHGRLLLWLGAGTLGLQHFPWGVGPRQFGDHHLATIHALYTQFPSLRAAFGSYTGTVLDAHNVFLQHLAELGLPGLGLSLWAVWQLTRWVRPRRDGAALALRLLLAKSLYTVVLGAVSSTVLLAFILALLTPARSVSLRESWRPAWLLAPMTAAALAGIVLFAASDRFQHQGTRKLQLGQLEQAGGLFSRALQLDTHALEASLGLAQIAFQRRESRPMRDAIDRAIASEANMNTLKISAHMLFFTELYEDALPLYTYLYALYPEHLTTKAKLALIYFRQKDLDRASTLAQEVLDTQPRVRSFSDESNRRVAREILARADNLTIYRGPL